MIRWCKYLNSTEFTVFNNYVKKYSIIILWIILGALHNFEFYGLYCQSIKSGDPYIPC